MTARLKWPLRTPRRPARIRSPRALHVHAIAAACALAALLTTALPAEAQRRDRSARLGRAAGPSPAVGVRGSYDFDAEAWGVGAQASIPLGRRFAFVPSGDAFFGDDRTDWQLNTDLAMRLGRAGFLYAGGGLAVVNRVFEDGADAETKLGPNLFAGLQTPGMRLPVRPFVEARWTFVEDEAPFRLGFGVNVPLGERERPRPRSRRR